MHTGPLGLTQATGHAGGLGYLSAYSYVVATAAALTAIPDAVVGNSLADGTQGVVMTLSAKEIWVLDTTSLAVVDGTTVVYSNSSGSLPGNPGRWILITSSALVSQIKTDVIFRPATPASAGLVLKTWAEVEAAAVASEGLLRVWMDPTGNVDPTTVNIPATANTLGKGMMEFHSAVGHRVNVLVDPGGQVTSLGMLKDIRIVSDLSSLADPLVFVDQDILRMENSMIQPALDLTAKGMFTLPAATSVTFYVDQDSSLRHGATGWAGDVTAGARLTLEITRNSSVQNNGLQITGNLDVRRDASVDEFTFVGAGVASWVLIDKAADARFNDAATAPAIVPTPINGGPSIQQAIDALKPFQVLNVTADPGWVAGTGILTITHNKGVKYLSRVEVYDNNDKLVIPDEVLAVDANTLAITLLSFESGGNLVGTWNASVGI